MNLDDFIKQSDIPEKCSDNLELCKLDEGSFKKVYRYKQTEGTITKITIFTKQKKFNYFDPIKTWKILNEIEDKQYLLLPDAVKYDKNYIYAQFTYCQSDLTKSMDLINQSDLNNSTSLKDQSLYMLDSKTRNQLDQELQTNFLGLEETIKNIHDEGPHTLDIKPENMLFNCENKAKIVLTDLDGAGLSFTTNFTWFGLNEKDQDFFALYVSIFEILDPTFFNKLPKSNSMVYSKHYLYGQNDPKRWIKYCEEQIKDLITGKYAKEIASSLIPKLKKMLRVPEEEKIEEEKIEHVNTTSYFNLKF